MKNLKKLFLVSTLLTFSGTNFLGAMEYKKPLPTPPQKEIIVPTYPAPDSSSSSSSQSVVVMTKKQLADLAKKKGTMIITTTDPKTGVTTTTKIQATASSTTPTGTQKSTLMESLRQAAKTGMGNLKANYKAIKESFKKPTSSSSSFDPFKETDSSKFAEEEKLINFMLGIKDEEGRKTYLKKALNKNKNIDIERLWVCAHILKLEEIEKVILPFANKEQYNRIIEVKINEQIQPKNN